ncbi:MAG: OsmC family protein [Saprospiraceae bacterium]
MTRQAVAKWQGSGKEGNGTLSTQSGVLAEAQYSYKTRFEDGIGTNPEELIAAAHAGCFTMKISFLLGAKGFVPTSLETDCAITIESAGITTSHLKLAAVVDGISQADFDAVVEEARANCHVSKLLNLETTLESTLNA